MEHLVVISKTSTIIETSSDNERLYEKLIYAESLIDKISELELKYMKPRITKKVTTQLTDTLLKKHELLIPNVFEKYNLSQNDIKPGVQCTNCNSFDMEYISASWTCSQCHFTSKIAHLQAIKDYFLLINQTLTRKQLAEFLKVPPIKARNFLLTQNFPSTGTKRSTKYHSPKNCILFPLNENDMKKGEFFT